MGSKSNISQKSEAPATPEGVAGRRECGAEPVRLDYAVKITVLPFPEVRAQLYGDRDERTAVGTDVAAVEVVDVTAVHDSVPVHENPLSTSVKPPPEKPKRLVRKEYQIASTAAMNCSPRSTKFLNWPKLGDAGERRQIDPTAQ